MKTKKMNTPKARLDAIKATHHLDSPALLNTRVPQPRRYSDYGVPPAIAAACDAMLAERNVCDESDLEDIDAGVLRLLSPWIQ